MIISWTPASFAAEMMDSELASGSNRQILWGAGPREPFDTLRRLAGGTPRHVGHPLIERRAVEPHLAAEWLPYPDERAHQRGFARSARPDDAQPVAGLQY